RFAAERGIPYYNTLPADLIRQCKPDGVMILTQPRAYPWILENLHPFALPTFLEKPIAYTVADAEVLRQWLPAKVFVGLNRRFYANVQAVRPMIDHDEPIAATVMIPERWKDYQHKEALDI